MIKFVAGYLSSSISIISEAVHSLSDLCASFIAFMSVQKSKLPPDVDHQFGHQKYEDLAGLIEGLLIILQAFISSMKRVQKLFFTKSTQLMSTWALLLCWFQVLLISL
ncbi:MAG: cation transporter [Candidatus Melainabacteria bacterium]|nr:MAG: cation transporter [Candidatus Melainabacteria bacterium]